MTLPRWSDSDDGRAGALFRAARAVQPLTPPPLESARERLPRLPRTLAVALVLGSVFALAAASSVVLRRPPTLTPAPSIRAPRFKSAAAIATKPDSPIEAQPTVAPAVSESVSTPRPRRLLPASPPPSQLPTPTLQAPEVPTTSTLGEEARLLAEALVAAQRGDPARAVEVLRQYRAKFPAGVLSAEGDIAEARAERALHHSDEALAALDRLDAGALAERPEVQLMRAELLIDRGAWAEAVALLDTALRGLPHGSLAERAHFLRAKCAVLLQAADAHELLEAYLRAWPGGEFEAQVKGLLEDTP